MSTSGFSSKVFSQLANYRYSAAKLKELTAEIDNGHDDEELLRDELAKWLDKIIGSSPAETVFISRNELVKNAEEIADMGMYSGDVDGEGSESPKLLKWLDKLFAYIPRTEEERKLPILSSEKIVEGLKEIEELVNAEKETKSGEKTPSNLHELRHRSPPNPNRGVPDIAALAAYERPLLAEYLYRRFGELPQDRSNTDIAEAINNSLGAYPQSIYRRLIHEKGLGIKEVSALGAASGMYINYSPPDANLNIGDIEFQADQFVLRRLAERSRASFSSTTLDQYILGLMYRGYSLFSGGKDFIISDETKNSYSFREFAKKLNLSRNSLFEYMRALSGDLQEFSLNVVKPRNAYYAEEVKLADSTIPDSQKRRLLTNAVGRRVASLINEDFDEEQITKSEPINYAAILGAHNEPRGAIQTAEEERDAIDYVHSAAARKGNLAPGYKVIQQYYREIILRVYVREMKRRPLFSTGSDARVRKMFTLENGQAAFKGHGDFIRRLLNQGEIIREEQAKAAARALGVNFVEQKPELTNLENRAIEQEIHRLSSIARHNSNKEETFLNTNAQLAARIRVANAVIRKVALAGGITRDMLLNGELLTENPSNITNDIAKEFGVSSGKELYKRITNQDGKRLDTRHGDPGKIGVRATNILNTEFGQNYPTFYAPEERFEVPIDIRKRWVNDFEFEHVENNPNSDIASHPNPEIINTPNQKYFRTIILEAMIKLLARIDFGRGTAIAGAVISKLRPLGVKNLADLKDLKERLCLENGKRISIELANFAAFEITGQAFIPYIDSKNADRINALAEHHTAGHANWADSIGSYADWLLAPINHANPERGGAGWSSVHINSAAKMKRSPYTLQGKEPVLVDLVNEETGELLTDDEGKAIQGIRDLDRYVLVRTKYKPVLDAQRPYLGDSFQINPSQAKFMGLVHNPLAPDTGCFVSDGTDLSTVDSHFIARIAGFSRTSKAQNVVNYYPEALATLPERVDIVKYLFTFKKPGEDNSNLHDINRGINGGSNMYEKIRCIESFNKLFGEKSKMELLVRLVKHCRENDVLEKAFFPGNENQYRRWISRSGHKAEADQYLNMFLSLYHKILQFHEMKNDNKAVTEEDGALLNWIEVAYGTDKDFKNAADSLRAQKTNSEAAVLRIIDQMTNHIMPLLLKENAYEIGGKNKDLVGMLRTVDYLDVLKESNLRTDYMHRYLYNFWLFEEAKELAKLELETRYPGCVINERDKKSYDLKATYQDDNGEAKIVKVKVRSTTQGSKLLDPENDDIEVTARQLQEARNCEENEKYVIMRVGFNAKSSKPQLRTQARVNTYDITGGVTEHSPNVNTRENAKYLVVFPENKGLNGTAIEGVEERLADGDDLKEDGKTSSEEVLEFGQNLALATNVERSDSSSIATEGGRSIEDIKYYPENPSEFRSSVAFDRCIGDQIFGVEDLKSKDRKLNRLASYLILALYGGKTRDASELGELPAASSREMQLVRNYLMANDISIGETQVTELDETTSVLDCLNAALNLTRKQNFNAKYLHSKWEILMSTIKMHMSFNNIMFEEGPEAF